MIAFRPDQDDALRLLLLDEINVDRDEAARSLRMWSWIFLLTLIVSAAALSWILVRLLR